MYHQPQYPNHGWPPNPTCDPPAGKPPKHRPASVAPRLHSARAMPRSDRRLATSLLPRLCPVLFLCNLGCPPPTEPPLLASTTDGETTGEPVPDSPTSGTTTPTLDDIRDHGDSGDSDGTGPELTDPEGPPDAPILSLTYSPIKQFEFTWTPVPGAVYYEVSERLDPDTSDWTQLGLDLPAPPLSWSMPLHLRADARYSLRACNKHGCRSSPPVPVDHPIVSAVGYFKASNAGKGDAFGEHVVISADGDTLVVGATLEDSGSHDINGNQELDISPDSGAVYVFVRDGDAWKQQAYLKASNVGSGDYFGRLAVSADGDTIAVGAVGEDSAGHGVGGEPSNNAMEDAGAVYIFARKAGLWSQQAYIKAPNPDKYDHFGASLALSTDGDLLIVGAPDEDSAATGIDGDPWNDDADNSGAVHVYRRADESWSYDAYIKASNTGTGDNFGSSVAISANASTLVVGAPHESSGSAGVDGDQADDSAISSGAVYVFTSIDGAWQQQAYLKPAHPTPSAGFGASLALSSIGDTLAVGARGESSASTEIDGDPANTDAERSGAAFVFTRAGGAWKQQAYIKAPNGDAHDLFGASVALSASGDMLAVGARGEDGGGSGVTADLSNKSMPGSGAAYIFTRSAEQWSHRRYIKATIPDSDDWFGEALSLTGDGTTLVVGAPLERSLAAGIGGLQTDNSGHLVGAVYMY